ncbi:hypothetical protein IT072_09795 [Leifsonia sp. ZF2019]|uniref:hypothetical protein n=1 Tax=Leifsonia sp. ZF2019 TaxID=2781978 RepID=UPI001CC15E60|nr:hypothetical protein [Leifsonia sp. ZF2019]UAJ81238.1 hypothetical protein IT072_09795 [Leifsonia sp. ZF2019]
MSFWTAVGRLRLSDVFSFETLSSIVLGVGLAWYLAAFGALAQRTSLASSFLAVVAALVAIVFAGLALVASLLSDTYLRLLRTNESGVLGFFRPFLLAVGVQVATLIGTAFYLALSPTLPRPVEEYFFGLVATFFFASCFEIVVLTRSVLMHALLRSRLGELIELETEKERKRKPGA